jgi:2-polyprenyl-3-methyl-5-hydroxy-6-metoxy-1,4-benzoquinol methylase
MSSFNQAPFVPAPGQAETLNRMAKADHYNAWLIDRCAPFLGQRILDVGAGIGTFVEMVAPGRDLVVAVEPDQAYEAALASRLAEHPNVVVVQREVADLRPDSFETKFDSIICFNVLEHIRNDEAALKALRLLLAPSGHLLLLVPAHPFLFGGIDRAVGHERRYQKDSLRQVLERAGLAAEVLRYVNPLGALGWFVSARILRQEEVPRGPLRIYDRLVPALRTLDHLEFPFGLSLWCVARSH